EIAKAVQDNQVVVICGETGSGKTTQLPKICLELGRGVAGMIGHTQPRRIAARSVAQRIAEELNSRLGDIVGYKVRFGDKTSPARTSRSSSPPRPSTPSASPTTLPVSTSPPPSSWSAGAPTPSKSSTAPRPVAQVVAQASRL